MGDRVPEISGTCSTNSNAKRRKSLFRYIADSISSFVPSGMFSHAGGGTNTNTDVPVRVKSESQSQNHLHNHAPVPNRNFQVTNMLARPAVNNVDLDAGETSDADLSAHSSTSGVSSLLPKNFISAKVDDFLSLSSSASTQIPCGYLSSGASSEVLDSAASTSTYCNRSTAQTMSPSCSKEFSFFSKPAKRQCPSDYHSEISQASDRNTSMFYRSRTTYGGAASCRSVISRQKNLHSTVPLRFELEPQLGASHSNSTANGTNLSSTARRILESLERFSTPLASAERIPLPLSETPRHPNVIAKSFRTHRFPPYALAYHRMKAAERRKYQSSTTDVTLVEPPVNVGTSQIRSEFPTVLTTKSTLDATTPTLTNSAPIRGTNLAFRNLPPLADSKAPCQPTTKTREIPCGPVLSSTATRPIGRSVDNSDGYTFSFATPIRRPPSVAAQLALMTSEVDTSTAFTFSLPTRLNPTVSTCSLSTLNYGTTASNVPSQSKAPSTSSVTSPIFDLIVCAPPRSTAGVTFGNLKALTTNAPTITPVDLNTWRCTTCLLENVDTANSCRVCSTPRVNEPVTEPFSSASNVCRPVPACVTNVSAASSVPLTMPLSTNTSRWECPTCMVRNDQDKITCPCCQTANPSGSKTGVSKVTVSTPFSFGSPVSSTGWECPTCMVRNTADKVKCPCCGTAKVQTSVSVASSVPLTMPLSTNTSRWECPTCMVRNDQDKLTCPCCQTANPSGSKTGVSKVTVSTPFSFGSPVSSTGWECPTCMVRNTADKDKCPCCSTLKPGVKLTVSLQSFPAFGSAKLNTAVASASASPPLLVSSSGAPVRFGLPNASTDSTSTKPQLPAFTNSLASQSSSVTKNSGLVTSQTSTTGVSGSNPSPAITYGAFKFGIKTTQETAVSTSNNPVSSNSVFGFRSAPQTSTAVTESRPNNGIVDNPTDRTLASGNASSFQPTHTFKLFGESGKTTTAANNGPSLPVSSSASGLTFAPPSSAVYKFGAIPALTTTTVTAPSFSPSVPSFSVASFPTLATATPSTTKPAFVFGIPNAGTSVLSPSQPVQPPFGQSTPTPFVFGQPLTSSVPASTSAPNPGLFCFGGSTPDNNLFTKSNASNLGPSQNPPGGNIFSAGSSSSVVPRKKVHAVRRLNR